MAQAARETNSRKGKVIMVRLAVRLSFSGICPKPMATREATGRLKTMPRTVSAPTTSSSVLKILEASRFSCCLLCFFCSVSTGTKAADSEVSANRSRSRLGMRKAALKASVERLEPKR